MSNNKSSTETIALTNQKGGVGKTTTAVFLSASLAQQGKKVLLVDLDPQANATMAAGYPNQDDIPITINNLMANAIRGNSINTREAIMHTPHGYDLIPSCIQFAGIESELVTAMARDRKLLFCLSGIKDMYNYILIDCPPSLGQLTLNALTAADSVIIPVQSHYFSARGLEMLSRTIGRARMELNPELKVKGIVITMHDERTLHTREIVTKIREAYSHNTHIFNTVIPYGIRAADAVEAGMSIQEYSPKSKVAQAYSDFGKEVVSLGGKTKTPSNEYRAR